MNRLSARNSDCPFAASVSALFVYRNIAIPRNKKPQDMLMSCGSRFFALQLSHYPIAIAAILFLHRVWGY